MTVDTAVAPVDGVVPHMAQAAAATTKAAASDAALRSDGGFKAGAGVRPFHQALQAGGEDVFLKLPFEKRN